MNTPKKKKQRAMRIVGTTTPIPCTRCYAPMPTTGPCTSTGCQQHRANQ